MWTSQSSTGGVNSAIQAKSLATLNRFWDSTPGIKHTLIDTQRQKCCVTVKVTGYVLHAHMDRQVWADGVLGVIFSHYVHPSPPTPRWMRFGWVINWTHLMTGSGLSLITSLCWKATVIYTLLKVRNIQTEQEARAVEEERKVHIFWT